MDETGEFPLRFMYMESMPRLDLRWICRLGLTACMCMMFMPAYAGGAPPVGGAPPFDEIVALIGQGQSAAARSLIDTWTASAKNDRDILFRLELLRTESHLAKHNIHDAIKSFHDVDEIFRKMSSEQKDRSWPMLSTLSDRVMTESDRTITELIREGDFVMAKQRIAQFYENMMNDRGSVYLWMFWGSYNLASGNFDRAAQAGRFATGPIRGPLRRSMKQIQDNGIVDTYFVSICERLYGTLMISYIRMGQIDSAKRVKEEMIDVLKMPPDRQKLYEGWFASHLHHQAKRVRFHPILKPVMGKLFQAARSNNRAALQSVMMQPASLPREIAALSNRETPDMDWKILDVTGGDTEVAAGTRVAVKFVFTKTVARKGPKAEDYVLEGIQHDNTVDDIRDVINQEYATAGGVKEIPERYDAIFRFDGQSWKIEKIRKTFREFDP